MKLKIGLLGCGGVGKGLVELLDRNCGLIAQRSGVEVSIKRVLVRSMANRSGDHLTCRAEDIVDDPEIDLVVEVMGGLEPARSLALQALNRGKHLVTANKLVLAEFGRELFDAARKNSVRIGFEASVCGAIPIVRALSAGLAAVRIESIIGILNSTSNFILHQMESGERFEEALRVAQAKGYAESDPSLDVDGPDAAHKLAILAWLAFGNRCSPLILEGIRGTDPRDLSYARSLGYVVRHIGVAWRHGLRVHPALLPRSHPLASVRNEDNAVLVRSDSAGDMLFAGRGAGSLPTAGAVLSDVIDIALGGGCRMPGINQNESDVDFASRYYVRIIGIPGILGLVSSILESHGVGVRQALTGEHLVLLTDLTCESKMRPAMAQLARQPIVRRPPVLMRVVE